MGVRRQAREAALQALFQCDFISEWNTEAVSFCFEHFSVSNAAQSFALKLCQGVIENLPKIDGRLTCASENWSLSRMGRVDRAILRLATFEIVLLDEVPINVAINEAIEIAKRFGSEESPVFINGVLDKVASTLRAELKGRSDLNGAIEIEHSQPVEDIESVESSEELSEVPLNALLEAIEPSN